MRLGLLAALFAVLAALVSLGSAAPAGAAAPEHDTFTFVDDYIDTQTCGFPISIHVEFTNMVIDSAFLTGTGTLQLHQRDLETWTANGVTLRGNGEYTIFVAFVDGVPQTATHVGLLNSVIGPNGEHLFFRTGQAVYQVVFDPNLGYYVDGPQITRHGIRDNFDVAEICAAFG
jgi:hypothetical protein